MGVRSVLTSFGEYRVAEVTNMGATEFLATHCHEVLAAWIEGKGASGAWRILQERRPGIEAEMTFNTFKVKADVVAALMEQLAKVAEGKTPDVTPLVTKVAMIQDETEAIREALRRVQGRVRNGVVPSALIWGEYNGLVSETMKLSRAAAISMKIIALTDGGAAYRQAKVDGRNQRCLIWSAAVEDLIK